MQTKQATAAYNLFTEVRAAHTGKSEAQVQGEISLEQFDQQIHALHQQYMNHEFTIGKLADLLEVPALNLYDILEELELPVRYS